MTHPELLGAEQPEIAAVPPPNQLRLADAAVGMLGLFGLILLGLCIPAVFGRVLEPTALRHFFVPLVVLGEASMLAYPAWVSRRRGVSPLFAGAGIRRVAVEGAIAIPVTFGFLVIFGIAVLLWGDSLERPGIWQGAVWSGNMVYLVILLVISFTVAPFAEEIFFRGLIYRALQGRCHIAIAVVAQATPFAALHHYYSTAHRLVVFAIGVFLALIYEWRSTILAPVFVHMIVNFIAAAAVFVSMMAYMNSPVLGAQIDPEADACRVSVVRPDTAAEKVGLKPGDVIESIDDIPVGTLEELIGAIQRRRVGDRIEVVFVREGRQHRCEAVLQKRP